MEICTVCGPRPRAGDAMYWCEHGGAVMKQPDPVATQQIHGTQPVKDLSTMLYAFLLEPNPQMEARIVAGLHEYLEERNGCRAAFAALLLAGLTPEFKAENAERLAAFEAISTPRGEAAIPRMCGYCGGNTDALTCYVRESLWCCGSCWEEGAEKQAAWNKS